jgi:arginyl-tRNA synthetase
MPHRRQELHFKMVFAAAKKAEWLGGVDGKKPPRIEHVGFGLVLGEDGKKFK